MKLLNQIFFATVICSVTGSGMFCIWCLLRKPFMRVAPKMIYATLRWVCFLYLLPLGYLAIVMRYRKWFQGEDQVWQLSFAKTPISNFVLSVWAFIWFVLYCILFLYRIRDYLLWKRKLEDSIPIDEGEEAEVFRDVCSEMGIPEGKVSLERNVLITIPMIFGTGHPRVVLPERDYSREELRMVFFHELSHFKHKDLWMKQFTVLISIIHSLNPVTYILLSHINIWSECMADALALEASGNLHNAKTYYHNILKLIPDNQTAGREKYVFSALFERENTLQKRIQFMKRYQKAQMVSGVITMVVTAFFISITTTIALLAGVKVADLHAGLYQRTENTEDMTKVVTQDGMTEYHCRWKDLERRNLKIVYQEEPGRSTLEQTKAQWNIEQWIIAHDTRYISREIDVSAKGSYIEIACLVYPNNKDYIAGIVDEEGNVCYIDGTSAFSHCFLDLSPAGYRIFIQNNSTDGSDVTVSLTYKYYYK